MKEKDNAHQLYNKILQNPTNVNPFMPPKLFKKRMEKAFEEYKFKIWYERNFLGLENGKK